MDAFDLAQIALDAHRRQPTALGACLRAVRAMWDVGLLSEARSVAQAFVATEGLGTVAGDALTAFARQAPMVDYPPGAPIIMEGAAGDAIYLLMSGHARVRQLGTGEVAQVGPGGLVGEVAPMAGTARTASVYARGEVRALRLPAAAVAELARYLPSIHPRLQGTWRLRVMPKVMGEHTVFGGLSPAERMALFPQLRPVSWPEGRAILEQGRQHGTLAIIVSGLVEVWREGPDGERQVLATLGPGDIFGEQALLNRRPANAHVEAASPVTMLAMSRGTFEAALASHPTLRARIETMSAMREAMQTAGAVEENAVLSASAVEEPPALAEQPPPAAAAAPAHGLDAVISEVPLDRSVFEHGANYTGVLCAHCGFPDAGTICPACGGVN